MSDPRSPLAAVLLRARASTLLVFLCTVVFVWQKESGIPDLAPPFYRNAFAVWSGDVRGFFLAMFGHANLLHFGTNMIVLLLYGAILEMRIGAVRILVAFIVAGIAGNVLGILWAPTVPSIGASGGALGLVGGLVAFGIRSGRSPWEFFGTAIARPLLLVIGIMIALGFVPGNILDNAAHLGGLVAGFVFVYVFGIPRVSARSGVVGRIAAAILLFQATAYALNPVLDARYWATRVIVFGARDEFSRARENLERLEIIEPDAAARRAIAIALEDAGTIEPLPLSGFEFAQVLHGAGRRDEAAPLVDRIEARHRELLAMNGMPPALRAELLNNLAWTFVVFDRKIDEAWLLALQATRIERNPAFIGTLGVAALRRGEFATARTLLEESVRRYDATHEASRANDLYYLSIALARLGEKDLARGRFEEAYVLRPDAAIAEEALEALGPRGA